MLFCWPLLLTAENLATSEPAALSVGKLTSEMQEGFVAVGRLPRLGWQLNSSDNGSSRRLMKSKSKTLVQGIRYGIVERLFPPKAS
mgnify:CR=1 FL=1